MSSGHLEWTADASCLFTAVTCQSSRSNYLERSLGDGQTAESPVLEPCQLHVTLVIDLNCSGFQEKPNFLVAVWITFCSTQPLELFLIPNCLLVFPYP